MAGSGTAANAVGLLIPSGTVRSALSVESFTRIRSDDSAADHQAQTADDDYDDADDQAGLLFGQRADDRADARDEKSAPVEPAQQRNKTRKHEYGGQQAHDDRDNVHCFENRPAADRSSTAFSKIARRARDVIFGAGRRRPGLSSGHHFRRPPLRSRPADDRCDPDRAPGRCDHESVV